MNLADVRRIYARQMLTIANAASDKRLEDAFAAVPREKFLGPGRWHLVTPWSQSAYVDRDPELVYQDVVIALDEERGVNNGSPSLHAQWMHRIAPREGEVVAHIGAGTGYYTAILAEIVGPNGHVTAVEFDAKSAERAEDNLSDRGNCRVVHANGCDYPHEPADVVYVNFAVPRPARPWIDKLKMGGRLVFPLGLPRSTLTGGQTLNSIAMLVTRHEHGYTASALSVVSFVFAEGLIPDLGETEFKALQRSLKKGGWEHVKRLLWDEAAADAECWYSGPGWALCF